MRPVRITPKLVRSWVPRRKPDGHKGDYGHVLVIAGSRGMTGAAVLCASGALRGGAGLVTAAVPRSQQGVIAGKLRPEAMTLALPETPQGTLSPRAIIPLMDFISRRKVSALALGPGLSRHPQTQRFVLKLLGVLSRRPGTVRTVVIDADAFFACRPQGRTDPLKSFKIPAVATPHPGELAAFFATTASRGQGDRLAAAKKFAKLYPAVCVLKGRLTLIAWKGSVFINPTGNPGMATGGSGDVLAGLIAALAGQGLDAHKAAAAGVYIHGLAGDLAARRKTQPGLLAGDLAESIPAAWKKVLTS